MAALTKNQVKKAGRILVDEGAAEPDRGWALQVAGEWRAAHREPLEDMERIIHDALDGLGVGTLDAFVASRIKRLESIVGKLRRAGLCMKLNEMNDIAGCRIVVPTLDDVRLVAGRISEVAPLKDAHSIKNYIDFPHPNNDGYRGIHLITRHDAPSVDLRGLFCETQVRTRLQHAWATALETYDVASRERLKFGRGSENAKRFFQITSALFAMAEGGSTTGVVTEPVEELRRELSEIEEQDHIQKRLQACSGSVAILSDESFSGAAYCVLDIDFELQCTSLYTFSEEDVFKAERLYFELERKALEGESTLKDAILVKVSSLKGLGDAYPNYLVNVRFFLESLSRLLA